MNDAGEQAQANGPDEFAAKAQDPLVQRRRPRPTDPVEPQFRMVGFLGDSDVRRLYFTTDLDYYAEFAIADVVAIDSVPADAGYFLDEESTRVTLRRGAELTYTRTATVRADVFDLDPQFDKKTRLPDGGFGQGLGYASLGHGTCHCTQWTFCHQVGCADGPSGYCTAYGC